jgi:dihydroorotase
MKELQLARPDDWHIHLRDGSALARTVTDCANQFARAIVMPNLVPPVSTTGQALAYRQRILDASAGAGASQFEPLMTLYLTDNTSPDELQRAHLSGHIYAAKLYPAGATTNSDQGVTNIQNIYPALEAMQELGMPLLIHGEVTDNDIDVFDREATFIDRTLSGLVERFTELKIVLEHITTRQAVDFVSKGPTNLAATITAHHLLYNRNHMLAGKIKPHFFCLPILKRDIHQQALLSAATSGNPQFFLGTDSAPHARQNKETACGCAGIYSAHAALPFYAEAFEQAGALDRLEGFASHYGADFYGLPRNQETITLQKNQWQVPQSLEMGDDELIPLCAGETLSWQLID